MFPKIKLRYIHLDYSYCYGEQECLVVVGDVYD